MADYAAAPVQPIVQGLITVDPQTGAVSFTGRGAFIGPKGSGFAPGRGINALGDFILTLDPGLPGTAGAVEPVPAPVTTPALGLPAAPLMRTLITARAPVAGTPSTFQSLSVNYGNITDAPVAAGVGFTQIEILSSTTGLAATLADPLPPNANGLEVVVFAGVEQP